MQSSETGWREMKLLQKGLVVERDKFMFHLHKNDITHIVNEGRRGVMGAREKVYRHWKTGRPARSPEELHNSQGRDWNSIDLKQQTGTAGMKLCQNSAG